MGVHASGCEHVGEYVSLCGGYVLARGGERVLDRYLNGVDDAWPGEPYMKPYIEQHD